MAKKFLIGMLAVLLAFSVLVGCREAAAEDAPNELVGSEWINFKWGWWDDDGDGGTASPTPEVWGKTPYPAYTITFGKADAYSMIIENDNGGCEITGEYSTDGGIVTLTAKKIAIPGLLPGDHVVIADYLYDKGNGLWALKATNNSEFIKKITDAINDGAKSAAEKEWTALQTIAFKSDYLVDPLTSTSGYLGVDAKGVAVYKSPLDARNDAENAATAAGKTPAEVTAAGDAAFVAANKANMEKGKGDDLWVLAKKASIYGNNFWSVNPSDIVERLTKQFGVVADCVYSLGSETLQHQNGEWFELQ